MAASLKDGCLTVTGLRFGMPDAEQQYTASFRLPSGSSLIVVAPTGSGKSVAALRLAGLEDEQSDDVQVEIDGQRLQSLTPGQRAALVGLVPSNPALVFSGIARTLREEIVLSHAFLGREVAGTAINDQLKKFDLDSLAERDPLTLSGGEKVRAAIAITEAKRPAVLVIDQVLEELDPLSERIIRAALENSRQRDGMIVVELTSRSPSLRDDLPRKWLFATRVGLVQGTLEDCWEKVSVIAPSLLPRLLEVAADLEKECGICYPVAPTTVSAVARPLLTAERDSRTTQKCANSPECPTDDRLAGIEVKDLRFAYGKPSAFHLGPVTFQFRKGRATAVLGRNGAGKTTLLKCLGNLNKNWTGEVSVSNGGPLKSDPLHQWAKFVLYCFQNPDEQIFFPTALQELQETAKRTRDANFSLEAETQRIADLLKLTPHLKESPFDLARGVRRLITIGGAFIASPSVILLDEPTAGLDGEQSRRLVRLVQNYKQSGGTVVLISHDYDFVAETADDILVMEAGMICEEGCREQGFTSWPAGQTPAVPRVAEVLGLPSNVWREDALLEHARRISPQ